MLHYKDEAIKTKLFDGLIGLEKEGLRVTEDGFLAQSPHPFATNEKYIVRDFCENQTEINTPPVNNAREAYDELLKLTRKIKDTLAGLENKEYLWPFSNPPYILNEENIPIARFEGEDYAKTEYREYLAMRYVRYKMTFSGIHFNYSFDEDLLKADFELSGETDYKKYKDDFYVSLAASAQVYNWLVVAISAASPLLDSSYFEKGNCGKDVYNGMASSRCSDIGYWNFFTPILNYSDLNSYAESIDLIVKNEFIRSPSELYFPVRVKPPGSYSQAAFAEKGADHIELRMIDLNPLDEAGIDQRDILFLQLFLVFLACRKTEGADANAQIRAIANTKNAARFDLKTVHDARFRRYYDFLQSCMALYNYTLTGMGINPYRIYNQNVPVPNGRYRMLFHHLHSYTKYRTLPMYFHPHPEFGTFSSASQVQLDINYEDIPEVINTFSLLEPLKARIFANSVLLGEAEDYLCYRDILWENSTHGINPHNVGPYEYKFKDADELLDYIQSTSIYCTEREGKYVNYRPLSIRD